jgi:hypothetical protein
MRGFELFLMAYLRPWVGKVRLVDQIRPAEALCMALDFVFSTHYLYIHARSRSCVYENVSQTLIIL